jgi:hypothetical protein
MFVPSLLDDAKSSASLLKKKYNHRATLFQRFQPILKGKGKKKRREVVRGVQRKTSSAKRRGGQVVASYVWVTEVPNN